MSVEPADLRLVFMSLDDVLKARGLTEALHNQWWSFDPQRGIIFWKRGVRRNVFLYPQCNPDERISRMLTEKMYPWAEVLRVPLVLVRRNPSDY